MKQSVFPVALLCAVQLGLVFLFAACGEKTRDAHAQASSGNVTPVPDPATVVEKGLFFKPDLGNYTLHNEYDDDGNGDGVKETHVRRYIDEQGDTVFSMTTAGTLWAWSLDSKGGDEADIRMNYVIRDSNCDGVFDERYSLTAQFHVPDCLEQGRSAQPAGI